MIYWMDTRTEYFYPNCDGVDMVVQSASFCCYAGENRSLIIITAQERHDHTNVVCAHIIFLRYMLKVRIRTHTLKAAGNPVWKCLQMLPRFEVDINIALSLFVVVLFAVWGNLNRWPFVGSSIVTCAPFVSTIPLYINVQNVLTISPICIRYTVLYSIYTICSIYVQELKSGHVLTVQSCSKVTLEEII